MILVQFQQHTTLFGLKYMVELVLSVSNLSPSSELENFSITFYCTLAMVL
jgi:hypothetical protein